jgi:inorganic pyrophosphatase
MIIVLKFEKIPFSAKNRVIMHKQTATDIKSHMQKQTAFIPVSKKLGHINGEQMMETGPCPQENLYMCNYQEDMA